MNYTRRNFLSISVLAAASAAATTLTGCSRTAHVDQDRIDQDRIDKDRIDKDRIDKGTLALPPSASPSDPEQRSTLTVTVRYVGGFRLWGSDTSSQAAFHIHDRLIYRPGAAAAIYPGPAIIPMISTPITEVQSTNLRAKLDQLDLLGPAVALGAATWVADVPDTIITIVEKTATGTNTYTHQIAALDMDVPENEPSISASQRSARKAISVWVSNPLDEASNEVSNPSGTPVKFERYRITAQRQQRAELNAQYKDQELKWNEVVWPLSSPLTGDRIDCRDVVGADATALAPVVDKANQITYWSSGSDIYQLAVRGLLPGEPDCASMIVPSSVSP